MATKLWLFYARASVFHTSHNIKKITWNQLWQSGETYNDPLHDTKAIISALKKYLLSHSF
jgi:hypothetical protein